MYKNKALWQTAKVLADKVYTRPSAYKSGYIVKKYKELGGTFIDDDQGKSRSISKSRSRSTYRSRSMSKNKSKTTSASKNKGLTRWFAEKWVNQRGEIGYKYKSDVYRPSKRITSKTPTTWNQLTKAEISAARRTKSKGKRVNKFKT